MRARRGRNRVERVQRKWQHWTKNLIDCFITKRRGEKSEKEGQKLENQSTTVLAAARFEWRERERDRHSDTSSSPSPLLWHLWHSSLCLDLSCNRESQRVKEHEKALHCALAAWRRTPQAQHREERGETDIDIHSQHSIPLSLSPFSLFYLSSSLLLLLLLLL